jgi:hypothetical protein
MARRGIHLQGKPDGSNSPAERAARAELERQLERPLSDVEWAEQSKRLLQFVRILKRWNLEQQSGKFTAEPKRRAAS